MKIDHKISHRVSLLTLTAWMSVCLLISGFFPDIGFKLKNLWAMSGCLGLVASFGLIHKIKNELMAQHDLMATMKSEAETDALTSLANRRVVERQLSDRIAQLELDHRSFTFALVDIDHFKTINDTYGHQTGDRILKFVAEILRSSFEDDAIVGRYGGDEFAVISRSGDLERTTERLNRACSRIVGGSRESDGLKSATISVGMTLAAEGDARSSIIRRADDALYEAKNNGRNRVVVHLGQNELEAVAN